MDRLAALLAIAAGDQSATLPTAEDRYDQPAPADGPLDAEVVVVGESLGADEEAAWVDGVRPCNFVGRSGKKLRGWMRQAGIVPEKCYMTHVYPFYAPGGSIERLDTTTLRRWQADVVARVRACPRARVIVCIGNVALEAFTGHRDITRRRGSVYDWHGRRVLGTIHPAAVRKNPQWEKHCRKDWERVKTLQAPHETHSAYCGCALKKTRTHWTPWTQSTEAFHDELRLVGEMSLSPRTIMALDIETPKVDGVRQIVCVSFAYEDTKSLVLPFREYKGAIRQLCASPCIKVGHNIASFDRWWLKREGIDLRGEIRDTLCINHALDPASAHSLEYLVSTLTWEPWYKDEGHGHDEVGITDWGKYFAYCGLDSCCTLEIHHLLWAELERRGMVELYRNHYQDLFDPVLDLMSRGVPIDHAYRVELLEDLLREARDARDRLTSVVGKPLFTLGTLRDRAVYAALTDRRIGGVDPLVEQYGADAVQVSIDRLAAKTVSGAQLKEVLYGQLGLPVQLKRRAGGIETPTADAITLRKLRHQYAERADVVEVIDLAMRHNKAQKIASFCYPTHFSTDGRFRFTLKFNTEASRFASSAPPDGLGTNSQNNPRDDTTKIGEHTYSVRRMFLPEPGHILVEADLSQVEGRLCFVYTGDAELIRLARLRATEFDQHKFVASLIWKKPVDEVTRQERQVSKSIGHGSQRNMQGLRLSETLLKEGYAFSEEECNALIEEYHRAFPPIRQWHMRIRREVRSTKRLVSAWGHVWDVRYFEVNDELFRKAYSWKMQRDCAGITNQMGFKPLWYWLRDEGMQSRIMLQEHDSLVCSCPVSEVYDVMVFLKDHLEAERSYDGVALRVPIEFKLGRNWSETTEYKELPDRATVEAEARRWL